MYLVDLPGYGYAKVSAAEKAKIGAKMIEGYLHNSKELRADFSPGGYPPQAFRQ